MENRSRTPDCPTHSYTVRRMAVWYAKEERIEEDRGRRPFIPDTFSWWCAHNPLAFSELIAKISMSLKCRPVSIP
jgi:hypothetical protein